jgi:hypothetical protein
MQDGGRKRVLWVNSLGVEQLGLRAEAALAGLPAHVTTGRALRGTFQCHSGASPKWVSEASRQFRLSLLRRLHFCGSFPRRSHAKVLACRRLAFITRCGRTLRGGLEPPLRVRPRVSRLPQKPTSPYPDVVGNFARNMLFPGIKSGNKLKDYFSWG